MVLLADTLDVERGLLGAIKDTKTQYAARRPGPGQEEEEERGGKAKQAE